MRIRRSAVVTFWVAILSASVGCQQQRPDSSGDSPEVNKSLVRRWIEVGFNQRNLAVADEIFAEQLVVNGQSIGRDGLKQSMSRHLHGFPDLHVTVDDIVAEDQKVGIWYTVEGTHRGEFEGIAPTTKRVKWVGFDLFRIERRTIVEARFLSDFYGLLTQLGASVSLPQASKETLP